MAIMSMSLPALAIFTTLLLSVTGETYDTFLKEACKATSYPPVCYSSLQGYGTVVKTDRRELTVVSISVSLNATKGGVKLFSGLLKQATGADHSALEDCVELLNDGVDSMKDSINELEKMKRMESIDDVLTWMSAAITDLSTCTDGFEEPEDGGVKEAVDAKIGDLNKLTSNALSLVKWLSGR